MQVVVLATGKCRDKAILALENEYMKRMPKNWQVLVREIAAPEGKKAAREVHLRELEAFSGPVFKIALDETGAEVTSRALAAKIEALQDDGVRTLVLLIGGADGLCEEVRAAVDWVWSLGKLTLPHQMVRPIVAEQMYRAYTVVSGHPYHRD